MTLKKSEHEQPFISASEQFKKYMNLSPSEYRKKFLQNNEYYNYVKPWEKT